MNFHGGNIYKFNEDIIDFSANINPLGMPYGVQNALIGSISNCIHYPDPECTALRAAIARAEGTDAQHIICANGAAELIYCIMQALCPRTVLAAAPTFTEYAAAARSVGANVQYCKLNSDFDMTDDFIAMIPQSDIVFICNPNNPSGNLCSRRYILSAAEAAESSGAALVIDECFMDFVCDEKRFTAAEYIQKFNNIIVLRSFTKMYAMPGIRLGYAVCGNTDTIKKINAARQPWGISVPAQAAGSAALKECGFVRKTRKYIQIEKEFLYNSFDDLGINYCKSEANYILFKSDTKLYNSLLRRGILIRKCGDFVGLGNEYYRIAVLKHSDNVKLLNAII